MKTQPMESSIMLAGLTRGLWMDTTADRYAEHRGTWADPAARPNRQLSDAEMHGITSEDRATGSVGTTSDCADA